METTILQAILLAFQIIIALPVLYLVLLTLFAWFAAGQTAQPDQDPDTHFVILIPAHNEEKLLPACLASLAALDYPPHLVTVYVVADNCTDATAEVARKLGAVVIERSSETERGKGYALQLGLAKIWESGAACDAVVFLDADTVVSGNFLRVMAARIRRGERAIQAFYSVSQPERSWSESLRFSALAAVHYLRPQARMVLGGSAGLKGNGMVFVPQILREIAWTASLTEDIEYHMALLQAGERVTFAPDAVVWGEMPNDLSRSASQHDRWERGRLEAARRYVPRLLKQSIAALRQGLRQSFLYLDAAVEHLIPPFSILAGLSLLGLAASLVMLVVVALTQPEGQPIPGLAWANLWLGMGLLLGQIVYVISALRLVGASSAVYRAFLYAPVLIVWKIGQYARVLLSRQTQQWVRTERNEGKL